MARCINLDWLEVCVLEPFDEPRTPVYFGAKGFVCNVREYGTPIFKEMFTILDDHGNPFMEVRREPKSKLMAMNLCHLRFHNYYCYHDNAAQLMAQFIHDHGYQFQRISRVDICYDFEKFDSGDNPQDFLYRYINRVYSKINQANLSAHGTDTWNAREWNSLSWGSQTSDVGTKFYNKTMELYDPIMKAYKKPYIRYAWQCAGLVDDWQKVTKKDAAGNEYTPQIWRIEFSIRSSVKKWFAIELDGHQRTNKGKQKHLQSLPNTLDVWSHDNLIVMFASLAQHYFRFKYFEEGVRKDRCKDKVLFRWGKMETIYTIGKDDVVAPAPIDKPINSLLWKIKQFKEQHSADDIKDACDVLIKALEGEKLQAELNSPFRREEIQVLQQTIAMKTRGCNRDAVVLMNEIRELLRLNDRTCPAF